MANICENTLIIKGSKIDLNQLFDLVGNDFENGFSMEKIYPITDEMRNYCESHEDPEEIFWGTCDDVYEVSILRFNDNEIIIKYETKWTPNIDFINALSLMFPNLDFELLYAEAGYWFGGSFTVNNGDYCDYDVYPLDQVYFVKSKISDKFTFIPDYNVAKKHKVCNYILVPDLQYQTIFDINGYSEKNVENWDTALAYEINKTNEIRNKMWL